MHNRASSARDRASGLSRGNDSHLRRHRQPSRSVYYNAGLVTAIIYVEALRTGHKQFGNRPLTAAEGQWALEHLEITPQRIEELGATGLLSPLKVTPSDHEGSPAAKIVQWDGKDWHAKTDWLNGDRVLFHDAIFAKAAAYAKEKNLPARETATN